VRGAQDKIRCKALTLRHLREIGFVLPC